MFLRVVDVIVNQETKTPQKLNDEYTLDGTMLSEADEEELPSVHGESLRGESND